MQGYDRDTLHFRHRRQGTILETLAFALLVSAARMGASAGPLDCSDSAFGLVCAAIEAALGIEFPITQIAGDDAPLPFTGGTYTGLNSTRSSAGNEIEFSLPIDDSTSFGVGIEFSWAETERQLIPEPGGACLLLATGAITLLRRRRH